MSEMEAAGEDLGLLSKIRPPLLEDAGLEDCALPLDSIQEAFLKAAAAVGSRAASILIDDEDRGCVNDPWTEKSPPSDALVGIAPESGVPGPCANEKGGALGGNGESGSDVKGARNEGEMEKKDEVVVVGGGDVGDGGEDCVDGVRGLKIKENAEEREDDEKPTLVEGVMDSNTPRTFMSLLDGDDEVGNVEGSNTNAPTNTHMQHPPYHTQQNYPSPPPYYHLHYFPLPPPTYTSSASNSTPTETSKSPQTNNDTTNDEAEADEVEGGSVGAKKWSLEEDKRLITAWINTSVDPITGADQKRTSFWGKVAANFNTHAPKGAMKRSGKTCNARWNWAYPLVNKWVGIMDEMDRNSASGSNIEDIMNRAHETFLKKVGRKFDLEHWYYMLKDQPKWKIFCDSPDGGQSKRSKVNEMGGYSSSSTPAEEDLEVENDGTVRPIGRKAAKRKFQQKATNALVDLVTNHLSMLGATANAEVEIFRNLVTVIGKKATAAQEAVRIRDEAEKRKEKRAKVEMRKQALKERQYDDQIILMDLSTLSEEDAAYFTMMKEEIRQKRMGKAPQN